MKTIASIIRQLVAELDTMDRGLAEASNTMQTLGGRYVATPKMKPRTSLSLSKPPRRQARGHRTSFSKKLYQQTVSLIRASAQPLTTIEIRQQLLARKLKATSLYYHLRRAVKRGDVAKDARGHYTRTRPAAHVRESASA
jgi:hypothetical protein